MDVSILIANFNRENFLDRVIRSCQNQILLNKQLEIILVDDNSTDNSIQVVRKYSDEIKLIPLPENKGIGNASQVGLENSKGKYFVRVDSDDFISPLFLQVLTLALDQNQEYAFVYGDLIQIDEKENRLSKIALDSTQKLYNHGAGVLFRKQVLLEVGGYDSSLRHGEDMDLFIRLEKSGYKGLRLPLALYRYYKHSTNLTSNEVDHKIRKTIKERHDK